MKLKCHIVIFNRDKYALQNEEKWIPGRFDLASIKASPSFRGESE